MLGTFSQNFRGHRRVLLLALGCMLFLAAPMLFLAAPGRAAAKPKPEPHWVSTWATANWDANNDQPRLGTSDITLRQIVHTTLSGALVRVELSNKFGTGPLTIGATHLALAGENSAITLSSAHALTFNGQPTVVIPAGGVAVSDPAAMTFPPGADLAISMFIPGQRIANVTQHADAHTTSYSVAGNQAGRVSLRNPATNSSGFFLKSVDVNVPAANAAVVAFGDSITDGTGSTLNAHDRWEDDLTARLRQDKQTSKLSVVNDGIGGNRILNAGTGPSALTRFRNDVIDIPGARYVIILEGINDIGHLKDDRHPGLNITADQLIAALTELVNAAHENHIRAILGTLTPFNAANYFTPEGEAIRQKVNAWIRSYRGDDGFIDFDAAVRDPNQPDHFLAADQSGDNLHPSVDGYKAMADAIDLKLFLPQR